MPMILGCGGCGLLIVLGAIAFFVIGAIGKRASERHATGGNGTDTTIVAGDSTSASTGSDASPNVSSDDSASGTTGEGKPSEKPTGSTEGDTLPVREMQPLNP